MNLLKIKLKIFLTNWINVVGILIGVYGIGIISELRDSKLTHAIGDMLAMSLLAFIVYGTYLFFIAFILAMFLLDFILMNKNKEHLELKLLIQWAVISIPVIWLGDSVFFLAAMAFLFSQLLRGIKILKIIGHPIKYSFNLNLIRSSILYLCKNINYKYIFYLLILLSLSVVFFTLFG